MNNQKAKKVEDEAGFFSIINETISNDDLNFSDFIVIFKLVSNSKFKEEQIKTTLKEIFLEGGYDLKEIKFQYIIQGFQDLINKDKNNLEEKDKEKEKKLMYTSLSQLQTIKNNLIICCLTPMNLYMKNRNI